MKFSICDCRFSIDDYQFQIENRKLKILANYIAAIELCPRVEQIFCIILYASIHGGIPVVSKSGLFDHINLLQVKPCAKRLENMKVYVKPHN
jgi:hypothetical protein